MSPRQRQQEARLRRRVEVRFGDGVTPQGIGYSGNVSSQGIMIRTPRVYAPGTELDLELRFQAGTVKLRGVVMWAREGPMVWVSSGRIGMGVRFLDPPENLAERIASGSGLVDPARRAG